MRWDFRDPLQSHPLQIPVIFKYKPFRDGWDQALKADCLSSNPSSTTYCVTLGKFFKLSEPVSLSLKIEDKLPHKVNHELEWDKHKIIRIYSKYSINVSIIISLLLFITGTETQFPCIMWPLLTSPPSSHSILPATLSSFSSTNGPHTSLTQCLFTRWLLGFPSCSILPCSPLSSKTLPLLRCQIEVYLRKFFPDSHVSQFAVTYLWDYLKMFAFLLSPMKA